MFRSDQIRPDQTIYVPTLLALASASVYSTHRGRPIVCARCHSMKSSRPSARDAAILRSAQTFIVTLPTVTTTQHLWSVYAKGAEQNSTVMRVSHLLVSVDARGSLLYQSGPVCQLLIAVTIELKHMAPFAYKRSFTKTGSGQTYRENSKSKTRLLDCTIPEARAVPSSLAVMSSTVQSLTCGVCQAKSHLNRNLLCVSH